MVKGAISKILKVRDRSVSRRIFWGLISSSQFSKHEPALILRQGKRNNHHEGKSADMEGASTH
jgi:hypothetical protein